MSASAKDASMDAFTHVVRSVREKGVRLWLKNGQLHYKAPVGALTSDEVGRLKESKHQIVALLEKPEIAKSAEQTPGARPRLDSAPLTFSQLAYWHALQSNEMQSFRTVAAATRLRGPLNIDALSKSVAENIRRHDALRTRIIVSEGIPTQVIDDLGDFELQMDDFTSVTSSDREDQVRYRIERLLLEPVDIAVDPLFGIHLFRLDGNEHVLLIALEHMISDAYSLGILLRDILDGYRQVNEGSALNLPPIPVQFADYAVWQRSTHKTWIDEHGQYWAERLSGCQRLRFPEDGSSSTKGLAGWENVPICLGKEVRIALREWCRLKRTTVAMSVFTAYVALVLRWCGVSQAVIRYQNDGRGSPKTQSTVGYFASCLYLRVDVRENDNFIDLMRRLTKQYSNAHEHADFSYIDAQEPSPEFARNPLFNWIPRSRAGGDLDFEGSQGEIAISPFSLTDIGLQHIQSDDEPVMVLNEMDEEISGGIQFPASRFSLDSMERFGRSFLALMEALLRHPEQRVKDVLLP